MSDATVLLEVRGLGRRFEPRAGGGQTMFAIRDLSFDVRDGELLTIVGPSGSGKSTLLNLIAQIDAPTEGEIRFRGEAIAGPNTRALRPGWDRQFGYVTQDDTLLPWRTLLDNVLFPLRVQGRLSAETRARAAELMRAVGLDRFERYYPHELSGGMRKRAALIRTLVYDPPVILMDEPFGALDAQTRTQLQTDLLQLWSRGRKTIVFVTHDIAEAIALGDRALVFTRAPARVQSEHRIPIARPRDVRNIYLLDGFAETYERIRKELS
ncbi:MAG TPA: ABC transporter ATP-binding protein [Methylomirabilota bacterium]